MTILICGGSGILGQELCELLHNQKIDYIATYNKNKIENGIQIDFSNKEDIRENLTSKQITVCVNCIVERQVNICETNWETIKTINVNITNNIAKVCSELGIFLIHISTDYVFDGKNPPYYPSSQVNPLQNYGISKLMSEYKVISNCTQYAIIRVPVLYTEKLKSLEDSAVTLIGKKILDRRIISKEDNYSIRRPNYIPDFCHFILNIIHTRTSGTFHFCNPHDKVTKYEVATCIANYLEKNINVIPIDIEPNDGVERPIDTLLLDTTYNIVDYSFTPFIEGIKKCFRKLYHPPLQSNNTNLFLLIDLDGTLIDTDKIHYYAYERVFKTLCQYDISYDEYNNILETTGIDNFIKDTFGLDKYDIIKSEKNKNIKETQSIEFVKNAQLLIDYIHCNQINHAVVTNTSGENVTFFKSLLPDLNKLSNWVVRENYVNPKPSSECYQLAKELYYKGEDYMIGFENTLSGYKSIQKVTDCIYMIINTDKNDVDYIKKQDVFLIDDFTQVF